MSQADVDRYERLKKLLNSKGANALPDKGKRINEQMAELERKIKSNKDISSPNSDSNSSKSINESSQNEDSMRSSSADNSINNNDASGESVNESDDREDEDEQIRDDLKHKRGFKITDTKNYREAVQDDDDDDDEEEDEEDEEDEEEESEDDDDDNEEEQSDEEEEEEEEDDDSFDNKKQTNNNKKTYSNVRKLESDDDDDDNDEDVVTFDTKSARNTVTVSDEEEDEDDEEDDDEDDDEDSNQNKTENDESDIDEFKYKNKKKKNIIDSINESKNVSQVLDIDKLNSVSRNVSDKNAFVSDKLKHLGLNDTNENESFEIDTRKSGTKKKLIKNIEQDDSIEWLNDSNSTKPINHKKLLGYTLSETPDGENNSKKDIKPVKPLSYLINETPDDESNNLRHDIKNPYNKTVSKMNLTETPEQSNHDSSSLPNLKENENISSQVINDSIISDNESLPYVNDEKQQEQQQSQYDSDKHDDSSINQKKFSKKKIESDESDVIQIIESPEVEEKHSLNDSVAYKKIPKEERQISSWSPNYEKIKAKLEKLERPSPRKTKLLNDLPSSIPAPNELAKKFNLTGGVSASTQRMYMKNLGSEEELKQLSVKIMQIVNTKPRPDDVQTIEPPKALKVSLLDHQYYALRWLKWREETFPRGGILADDMGLGKTLTTLCHLLLIKERREARMKAQKDEDDDEEQEEDDDDDDIGYKKKGAHSLSNLKVRRLKTLVIVPASLLHQWTGEIENRFSKGALKYYVYHEANRKKHSYNLEDNDIVFTTYEIATRELTPLIEEGGRPDSPLAQIKWKRLILDEAHRIKNHTTKANKVICAIRAKYRIAITGTPIQNSLNDFYSLIKFLHLSPLDDFGLWKYVSAIDSKNKERNASRASSNTQGLSEREIRLNSWLLLLSDLLVLRRTKLDIVEVNGVKRSLVELPEKKFEEVSIKLSGKEQAIYNKIFTESKDTFKKLLSNKITNMSVILVYLLRLRQACCHLSLLSECLDLSEIQTIKMETEGLDELVRKMDINKSDSSISDVSVDLTNVEECLKKSYKSSKLGKLLEFLEEIVENNPDDKLIIVSQWTSMLSIIAYHLKKMDLQYCEIRGDVNLQKRNEIVKKFNDPRELDTRIMLLSLNAGGVGLNLIGANRMFLLDIHWNPALEQQASDRIFRVGQKKNVFIYKFLCNHTIEERIQQIQQYKISIADKVCNAGAATSANSANSKLSLRDLKLLFTDFE